MKKAEVHHIDILEELLNEITPRERKRTENRMRLAAKIADAIEAKWGSGGKGKLAEALGHKSQSIVTKWLSGTNNFTTDVLSDIQDVLGIKLLNTEVVAEEEEATVYKWEYSIGSSQLSRGVVIRNEKINVESVGIPAINIIPWHGTGLTA